MRRNPGKTFVFLVVTLSLGSLISGAISVQHAIHNVTTNLRGDLPIVAIVEMDAAALDEYVALNGQWPEGLMGLNPQLLDEIGSLPYVKFYDYSVETGLFGFGLERYFSDSNVFEEIEQGSDWTLLDIKGVRSVNLFEIEEGVIELVSGRMFSSEEVSNLTYVTLISQNFAQRNNLHIGSTFNLQNIIWDDRGVEVADVDFYNSDENIFAQRSYDFEVVGIFVPIVEFDTGDDWADDKFRDQIENRIFVPNTVAVAAVKYQLEQIADMEADDDARQEDYWDAVWIQNIFVLHDESSMDDFKQTVEMLTPEFYTVTYTSDAFSGVAASLQSLEGLSVGILWASVAITIVILSLLTVQFIRDRKHEVGILLALGEGKSRVILQVLSEVLVIALVAMMLSLAAGNFLSSGISEALLRNDLIANHAGGNFMIFTTIDSMGFSNNVSVGEVLESYDTSLSVLAILSFFAVATATVLLSTIIPMLYILRLNPRKIMM